MLPHHNIHLVQSKIGVIFDGEVVNLADLPYMISSSVGKSKKARTFKVKRVLY